MNTAAPGPHSSAASTVTAAIAVVAMLWWGQRFLVPLTAGLMLAALVAPVKARLARRLHSAVIATVVTLLLIMGVLGAGAMAFGNQFLRVAERVPEMISLLAQQLAQGEHHPDSALARTRDSLQELDRAADEWTSQGPVGPRARRAAAARAAAASRGSSIATSAALALRDRAVTGSAALLDLAGDLSIILFAAFFVLTGGTSLLERFLDLWSHLPDARDRAAVAAHESAREIRIYIGVLLVTNTLIGIAVWVAFSVAGLPDAAGWGATAGILHVVPYLGIALLMAMGAAEAYLAHGTASASLGMAAYLIVLSTMIGTLGTAWLQGRASRVSPAAIFIGLMFWGALWGVWGLLLGPPLVVVLKVVAGQMPRGLRLARLMQA
jgi:predicted PurR-regulated permease PerM